MTHVESATSAHPFFKTLLAKSRNSCEIWNIMVKPRFNHQSPSRNTQDRRKGTFTLRRDLHATYGTPSAVIAHTGSILTTRLAHAYSLYRHALSSQSLTGKPCQPNDSTHSVSAVAHFSHLFSALHKPSCESSLRGLDLRASVWRGGARDHALGMVGLESLGFFDFLFLFRLMGLAVWRGLWRGWFGRVHAWQARLG
jgi:hypothetical protein